MYQLPHTIGIFLLFTLVTFPPLYIRIEYTISMHTLFVTQLLANPSRIKTLRYRNQTRNFCEDAKCSPKPKTFANHNGQPNRIKNGKPNWLQAIPKFEVIRRISCFCNYFYCVYSIVGFVLWSKWNQSLNPIPKRTLTCHLNQLHLHVSALTIITKYLRATENVL